jgi:hypothetical protein
LSTPEQKELVRKLLAGEYGLLFYYPQHDMTIERIWSDPGNPQALEELVRDPSAPGKARFIAAEVLFARDVFFINRVGRALVARLYTEALTKGYTGHANAWGLLWEHDDIGEVGSRFLVLGDEAIPALAELLDDDTIVDSYEGSEDATVGNRYRFRIKDFAAYYIGRITGHPVPFHLDHAGRDAEIERLKAFLATR